MLISRALSPAKPVNLYIDDEKKYCVAVFDDDEMDSGVGKSYLNVNLAAEVTNYTIEAVRQSDYEGTKKDSKIYLDQIKGLTPRMVKLMDQAEIHVVTDFINTQREDLLAIKGVGEKVLETISSRIDRHMENLNTEASNKQDETPFDEGESKIKVDSVDIIQEVSEKV